MPLSEIRQSDEWMIWNWIREKWAPSKKSSYRLYFKRLKYESRGIINGVRVQNRLEKRGFRILDTSEMSFSHQKELFSATSTVCSTTGASLLNMIFLRENSKILEIGYPSGDSWQFLADLLGMNYSRLEIESRLPIKTLETLDFYYARLKKIDRLVSNLI
jgi:capsular polysaccharide biosynthesis protein